MNKTTTRALLTAACLAAMTMAAGAAPLRADSVRHLSPSERAAAFKAAMAEQARARTSMPTPAAQDVTAPELKKISVARQATRSANGEQQLLVNLTVTDDWSGLDGGEVAAMRTDGSESQRVTIPGTFGGRSFNGSLALQFPPSLPAGEWKIVNVYGADANGNNYWYDDSMLASFGDLTFKVSSVPSADWAEPELSSGKIQTPVVYLSRPAKGTDQHPAMVRVEVNVVDGTNHGTSGISGVRSAELLFCSEANGQCFSLLPSQQDSIPYGMREAAFFVGYVLGDRPIDPGNYELIEATVSDWAGMYRRYDRANTDFSQIFGTGTQITIKR